MPHRGFSSDDAWYIKAEFIYSLLKIYEYYITEDLKPVPTAVYDDLRAIPDLGAMSHTWLRQLILVNLGLTPGLFFGIKNENVIHYAFFTITLATAKDNQKLSKLCRAMTISGAGRLSHRLTWINFHQVPGVLLKVCVLNSLSLHLSSIFSLNRWLTRDE